MKRKRSPSMVSSEARNKIQRSTPRDPPSTCLLIRIVQQYGLLEAIVSNLLPEDLLALALCSRSIYNAISPRPRSLENLLGKLSCPGRGVEIRKRCHKKSTFFYAYDCHEFVQCGGVDSTRTTESRPCVGCKVTTCNECRVHCVYQSICEKPCDPDDLLNFSGFVLLCSQEVPILSPAHLGTDIQQPRSLWQDPAKGQVGSYHDQGFLDVPFDDDTFGPPEFVDDVLDLDLGQHSLRASVSSNIPDPSPVLKAFYLITEQRKRWFCDDCLPPAIAKHHKANQDTSCRCTLRNRFLDRWLCLRCYEAEEAAMMETYPAHQKQSYDTQDNACIICLWCSGIVSEPAKPVNTVRDGSPNILNGSP